MQYIAWLLDHKAIDAVFDCFYMRLEEQWSTACIIWLIVENIQHVDELRIQFRVHLNTSISNAQAVQRAMVTCLT